MAICARPLIATEFDETSLTAALRSLRDSGMVVIHDAYPAEYVERLRTAYRALLASNPEGRVQPTSGTQHVQMQIPLTKPFADVAAVAHPVVVQIMARMLGPDFRCSYYNSNTAYPGSTHQRVHRDADPVFRTQFGVPTPATGIVLNVPLCDFTEENGSTEVWPGSHLIVDTEDDAGVELDERVDALASRRLNVPAGSLVLRDLRVWHRGTPNRSDRERSMIAVVYKRSWYGWISRALRVPRSTWDTWPEQVRSIFSEAPIDED